VGGRAVRRAAAELVFRHAVARLSRKFDAERAFTLLEKYGIRNAFLFPTALKLMMKTVPAAARAASTSRCARS
jgi:acyl-coenzyme A synthetase/AMP-(fatty) acid ligase